MAINHVFAGVAVADYDAALTWYERLLGRSPDVIVKEDEAMWQVADAGCIYVAADSNRAGKALLSLLVDDLEEHVAGLAERGLAARSDRHGAGVVRRAALTDPEATGSPSART